MNTNNQLAVKETESLESGQPGREKLRVKPKANNWNGIRLLSLHTWPLHGAPWSPICLIPTVKFKDAVFLQFTGERADTPGGPLCS